MCPKRLGYAALHSLNGLGPCFVQWVEILERLTARDDLRALTLLPWRRVLAADRVLRRYRAWCPYCYRERRDQEHTVYDSLLWMLAVVAFCPRHEAPLAEFCPHCEKRSLPLSARGRPGFCSHCDRWLGTDLPLLIPDELGQSPQSRFLIAREIGDLLSIGAAQNQPVHSHLGYNVQRAIADWAHGNRLLFCRIAGINEKTLIEWLSGKALPSLALLIRAAQNLRVPLKRLLLDEISAMTRCGSKPEYLFKRSKQNRQFAGRFRDNVTSIRLPAPACGHSPRANEQQLKTKSKPQWKLLSKRMYQDPYGISFEASDIGNVLWGDIGFPNSMPRSNQSAGGGLTDTARSCYQRLAKRRPQP